ncbi:unnamed protein product [Calicophoron daubneyi]|uniref:VPS37 C-terminal domain-containing protein n=1 Tax=Calicophoron daubneyi TaxID=300641 RepID=A0AAV2U2U8_CALDB
MAFNCALSMPAFNGVDTDEVAAKLDKLTKAELERLMEDSDGIKNLATSSYQVQRSVADKESNMRENRRLAESNLALEPKFLDKKQELTEVYSQLKEAKDQYQRLKSQIDALGASYAPTTILALMQAANAESEEKSEDLANQFVNKNIDVDTFLKQFIPLRKLCNERRFKSEKLAERLSTGRPVSSKPALSVPSSQTGSFRSSSPVNVSRSLYPTVQSRPESSPCGGGADLGFRM